eukprot:scaffold26215_cov107-Isochrysis_galbana.AAC.2
MARSGRPTAHGATVSAGHAAVPTPFKISARGTGGCPALVGFNRVPCARLRARPPDSRCPPRA